MINARNKAKQEELVNIMLDDNKRITCDDHD
jgi:hypothetical protein